MKAHRRIRRLQCIRIDNCRILEPSGRICGWSSRQGHRIPHYTRGHSHRECGNPKRRGRRVHRQGQFIGNVQVQTKGIQQCLRKCEGLKSGQVRIRNLGLFDTQCERLGQQTSRWILGLLCVYNGGTNCGRGSGDLAHFTHNTLR